MIPEAYALVRGRPSASVSLAAFGRRVTRDMGRLLLVVYVLVLPPVFFGCVTYATLVLMGRAKPWWK